MSNINIGQFKDNMYVKFISFNKAVLWRDRSISLPPQIISNIITKRK